MGRRQRSELVVGARVRVITPTFFVRCGYPMTVADEAKRLQEQCRPQIDAFLRSVGVTVADPYQTPKAVYEIAKAAAYELCRQKKFGGRDRTIYTREIPAAAGVECEVIGVRFVKTGTYSPPRGPTGNWTGDDDGEPACLYDATTHRILRTRLAVWMFDAEWGEDFGDGYDLEIEARHVELVKVVPAERPGRLTA